MKLNELTQAQTDSYHKDGYIIIKNFCSGQEVDKMYSIAVEDNAMAKNALDLNDQTGKKRSSLYGLRRAMIFLDI
jgi:hypothetical protein